MSDVKRCTGCRREKPSSDYYRRTDGRPNYGLCKVCRSAQQREKYAQDPARRARNQVLRRKNYLDRRHGMTEAEVTAYHAIYGNVCGICGSTEHLHIDHSHNCCPKDKSCEKCRRGLLCSFCNRALGLFHDDPELLRRAADYLSRLVLM